jgi:hypothetical protein
MSRMIGEDDPKRRKTDVVVQPELNMLYLMKKRLGGIFMIPMKSTLERTEEHLRRTIKRLEIEFKQTGNDTVAQILYATKEAYDKLPKEIKQEW